MKEGEYGEWTDTDYAWTPHGGELLRSFYNDSNKLVVADDNSVVVFKRTFTECADDICLAGIMAHEAAHSWVEWLVATKTNLDRYAQTPVEELIADQVGLELDHSNSIIIDIRDNYHLPTCSNYTGSACLDPAKIWHDFYSLDDIYTISNLVFGK